MIPESDANKTLLISGSHDPVLDHLLELTQQKGVMLHSSHTGSMGGILALKRAVAMQRRCTFSILPVNTTFLI